MGRQRAPPKEGRVEGFWRSKDRYVTGRQQDTESCRQKRQEAGQNMTADERRSAAIGAYYKAYREYQKLDTVREHMRVEMSGDALIEIHRYYGDRKGECVLRVTQEAAEEGAEVSAEVAAYEQAADQLLSMIKARRESLEEYERRRQEARRWA